MPDKKEEKEATKKERYELVEVPTDSVQMVRDNEDDSVHDQLAILNRIANDVAEIKKNLS